MIKGNSNISSDSNKQPVGSPPPQQGMYDDESNKQAPTIFEYIFILYLLANILFFQSKKFRTIKFHLSMLHCFCFFWLQNTLL